MAVRIEKLSGTAFLSFPDRYNYLVTELRERFGCDMSSVLLNGDMLYVERTFAAPAAKECTSFSSIPYFCRCAMTEPFLLHFDSIGEAAHALKNMQRNWAPYTYQLFRRSALIQEKLPYVNLKTRTFPCRIPKSPIGLYTLLDEHTILASSTTTSFLPSGAIQFEENHTEPPSRAYLKLQEALTMMQLLFDAALPQKGERCFEAGASPGGWTWQLVQLGCTVLAVDRSPLAKPLMENNLVTFRAHDAFTIPVQEIGACDWVFSDVICYPVRLFEWIQKWIASGLAKNMICTIKMQGAIDWQLVDKFAAIPKSRVVHLNYNKHELTWLYCSS
ncbi:MAG: SAM-dependent methyltransferase [Treponema sp.]|nr:SAM-dependent methyltransferase [Treponema sp.]